MSFFVSLLTHRCATCPHPSCLLSIIRGFRQGVLYGAKIRFPHALVMVTIFRGGSLEQKMKEILTVTYNHAVILGSYVALYKTLTCCFRSTGQTNEDLTVLLSGGLAGALIWGKNTAIKTQINLYVMSRVILGLLRLAVQKGYLSEWESGSGYLIYAAAIWSSVMWIHHRYPTTLQKSLSTSMDYLYHDSDKLPSKADNIIEWFLMGV